MKQKKSLHIIFLITLTFLLYINSFQNNFTNWDDQELIINNPKIKSLSAENILDIFTSSTGADYLPLKEISYALDYRIWKLNPFGYHLSNMILYAGNIVVVYLIISLLFEDSAIAFLASAYFAIHPVHVESVTWLSGRKDVLSGVFFFLSFYLYLKYSSGKRKLIPYILSVISFLFACFSKPVAVVLPLGIFLYEITFKKDKKNIFRIFSQCIPFVFISIFISYLTIRFGIKYDTVKSYSGFNLPKILISFNSVLFRYLKKIIFPINLCALYESDRKTELSALMFIILSVLLVLTVLFLLRLYQKRKKMFFCLAWFPLTLLPVSGIVPLSIEKADRYLFIPLFGVSMLVSFLFKEIVLIFQNKKSPLTLTLSPEGRGGCGEISPIGEKSDCSSTLSFHGKKGGTQLPPLLLGRGLSSVTSSPLWERIEVRGKWTMLGVILFIIFAVFLSILTIERNTVWKDSFTLWSDVIKKSPRIASAHNNLGNVFKENNQADKAIEEYKKAVEIDPENAKAHFNLASLYQEQGKINDAVFHYKETIRIKPDLEEVYNNLGNIFMNEGRFEEALKAYKESIKILPGYFLANLNLGVVYYKTGQLLQSIKYFEKALSLNPKSSDAWYFAGVAYEALMSQPIPPFDKVGTRGLSGRRTEFRDKAFNAYLKAYKLNTGNLKAKEKVKYLSLQSFRNPLPSDK